MSNWNFTCLCQTVSVNAFNREELLHFVEVTYLLGASLAPKSQTLQLHILGSLSSCSLQKRDVRHFLDVGNLEVPKISVGTKHRHPNHNIGFILSLWAFCEFDHRLAKYVVQCMSRNIDNHSYTTEVMRSTAAVTALWQIYRQFTSLILDATDTDKPSMRRVHGH